MTSDRDSGPERDRERGVPEPPPTAKGATRRNVQRHRSRKRQRILVGIGLLALFGVVGGLVGYQVMRASDEDRAKHYYELALRAVDQGNPDAAQARFEEALETDPEYLPAWFALGALHLAEDRDDEAMRCFEAILAIRTDHGGALARVAQIHLRAERLDQALAFADRAVRSADSPAVAFEIRGRVRVRLGDLGGALGDLSEVASRVPDEPLPCVRAAAVAGFLAARAFDDGARERAGVLLAEAERRAEPLKSPDARAFALGNVLLAQDRPAEAALALAVLESSRAEPGGLAAVYATALARSGARTDAERHLARGIYVEPDVDRIAALVNILIEAGAHDEARAVLDEGLRQFPDDEALRVCEVDLPLALVEGKALAHFVGAGLRRRDAFVGFEPPFRAALADSDTSMSRAAHLGVTGTVLLHQMAQGRALPGSVAAFRERVAAVGEESPAVAALWTGALAFVDGDVTAAGTAAGEALAVRPDWPEALLLRGLVRATAGDLTAALDDLGRASSAPGAPSAREAARLAAMASGGRAEDAAEGVRARLAERADDPWMLSVATGLLGIDARSLAGRRASPTSYLSGLGRTELQRADRVGLLKARMALERGEMDEALALIEAVIADVPRNREAHWLRRRVLLVRAEALRDAAREHPGNEAGWVAAIEAFVGAGDVVRARELVDEANPGAPSAAFHIVRARVIARAGETTEALAVLAEVLAKDATNESALLLDLEIRLATEGRTERVITSLRTLLRGATPRTRLLAARALYARHEATPADLSILRDQVATGDGLPDSVRDVLRGYLLLAEGKFDLALDAVRASAADDGLAEHRHVIAAMSLARALDYPGAIAELDAAIAAGERSILLMELVADLRLRYGLQSYARAELVIAEENLLGAVTGGAKDFIPSLFLAEIFARADGPGPEAVVTCHQLLESAAPASPAAPLFLGYVLQANARSAEAIAKFESAVERSPEHPATVAALVQMHLIFGDTAAAARVCEARLRRSPDRGGLTQYLLGTVRWRADDREGAVAAFKAALEANPGSRTALRALAQALVALGRDAEARLAVDRGLTVPASIEAATGVDLAWVIFSAGSRDTAREALLTILERRYDPWRDALEEGAALSAAGDLQGAERRFERAVAAAPGELQPCVLLLNVLWRQSRIDEAEARFRREAIERPEDGTPPCLVALIAESKGDATEAMLQHRRVLAIQPEHAISLNNLAWLLAEQGALAEAIDLAERAVKAAPASALAADTLGHALSKAGRYPAARGELERAVRLRPAHAPSWLRLAEVLQALGRKREAVDAYSRVAELDAEIAAQSGVGERIRELQGAGPR